MPAGDTLTVECRDEELVLHGSPHITCIQGDHFYNQSDPTCDKREILF